MHLNGYSEIHLVGEGGLGRVYKARRDSTGGVVAIKELRDVSAGSATWHRAQRELDALLRLKGHSNVINVEEVMDGPDGPCLIMEYAPGGSLFDRVLTGPLSAPELALVGQHVCDALSASHAVGVIHRDIKPHNLLIGAFGQVKVCDFGIASLARAGELRTKTGALTMAYASPEELDGSDDIGPATDVYSFAATMLHLASGRRPSFQDRVDATTVNFANNDRALATSITLLRQALAHRPADRPSIAELSAGFDNAAVLLGPQRIKVLAPTPGRDLPPPSVPAQPLVRNGPSASTIARPTEHRAAVPPTIAFAPPTVFRPTTQPEQISVQRKSRSGLLIAAAVALVASSAAVAVALTRDSGDANPASATNERATSATTNIAQAPTTATTLAPTTTVEAVITTTVIDTLASLVANDRPLADTLVGAWVPQLSAKYVGVTTGGITYDEQLIYDDHIWRRSTYGAILIDSGAFQFTYKDQPMIGWYLTVVPQGFNTKAEAVGWCKDHSLKTPDEGDPSRPVECLAREFKPPNP